MDIHDLLTCDIRDLKRLADRHGIACYIGTDGKCIVRPHRGTRPDVHAACLERRDELRHYVIANRPVPFDADTAADDAAQRVCGVPYDVLVALAIHDLNTWLSRAASGLLTYMPPLAPRWDDGIVPCDHPAPQAAPPAKVARPSGRFTMRGGGPRG